QGGAQGPRRTQTQGEEDGRGEGGLGLRPEVTSISSHEHSRKEGHKMNRSEYRKEIESLAKDIVSEWLEYEGDEDSLDSPYLPDDISDRVHEEVDGHRW